MTQQGSCIYVYIYIYIYIGKHVWTTTSDKWYEYQPATVTENNEAMILWDMEMHTDSEVAANKPDIVIKDQKNKTCKLIDMTLPSDRNTLLRTS